MFQDGRCSIDLLIGKSEVLQESFVSLAVSQAAQFLRKVSQRGDSTSRNFVTKPFYTNSHNCFVLKVLFYLLMHSFERWSRRFCLCIFSRFFSPGWLSRPWICFEGNETTETNFLQLPRKFGSLRARGCRFVHLQSPIPGTDTQVHTQNDRAPYPRPRTLRLG